MLLTELFSRTPSKTVWTKTGRELVRDDGNSVEGLRPVKFTNKLELRKADAQES